MIPETVEGRNWLMNWGGNATDFAEQRIANQEVYIQTDPEADRRGYYGRLLVYISQSEDAETSFNERLLQDGYARYYDSTFSQQSAYQEAESTARTDELGVWGYESPPESTETPTDSSGDVAVAEVHEDAEGNNNEHLTDEYVTFENTGDDAVDLTGWTVSDEAAHVYEFTDGFTLEAGAEVTLYTGSGADSDTELYWGQGRAVWNNGGDTVTLTDDNGEEVNVYQY